MNDCPTVLDAVVECASFIGGGLVIWFLAAVLLPYLGT